MTLRRTIRVVLALLCLSSDMDATVRGEGVPPKTEIQYQQALTRVREMENSLASRPSRNLDEYEKFADELRTEWCQQNKSHYGRLMFAVWKTLSSGYFKDPRQFVLAKKYAFFALESPDAVPLAGELELAEYAVLTDGKTSAPNNDEFAIERRKNVQILLHAWKRLDGAVDPNWKSDAIPPGPNSAAADFGLPSGISPAGIKDPAVRAQFEKALEQNRTAIEKYTQQYQLRNNTALKTFPSRAEEYVVDAYSKPPSDVAELKKSLDRYLANEKTRTQILNSIQEKPGKSK